MRARVYTFTCTSSYNNHICLSCGNIFRILEGTKKNPKKKSKNQAFPNPHLPPPFHISATSPITNLIFARLTSLSIGSAPMRS